MDDKLRQIINIVRQTATAAGHTAGRAVEATGKKAENLMEQTKLSFRIMNLEGEIDDIYRDIGKFVFAAKNDDTIEPSEIEEKIFLIEEKQAEIEKTHDRLDELKCTKRCPNPDCGKKSSKDDKFCNACGAVLED